MEKILILGYGNLDRQDDGVAWHILALLSKRLGRPVQLDPDEGFQPPHPDKDLQPDGPSPDLLFVLQLTPELAETIAQYERICFVDAHNDRVSGDVLINGVTGKYQPSPFTHHMTPATCLALSKTLYGAEPEAILVSARGYEFGFSRSLSARTAALLGQAVDEILTWLKQPPIVR